MVESTRARRRFLGRAAAAASALVLAGCDRLSGSEWFPKVLGLAERLNYAAAHAIAPRKANGAGIRGVGSLPAVSQQRHGQSRYGRVSRDGSQWLRRFSAGGGRHGWPAEELFACRTAGAPVAHADHAARLCRRLERDCQVEGRQAVGDPRCGAARGRRALRDVLLRRPDGGGRHGFLLREHRHGRRLPCADDPRVRNERRAAPGRERRAAAGSASSASWATSTRST